MIALCVILLFAVINLALKKKDLKAELQNYMGYGYDPGAGEADSGYAAQVGYDNGGYNATQQGYDNSVCGGMNTDMMRRPVMTIADTMHRPVMTIAAMTHRPILRIRLNSSSHSQKKSRRS